MTYDPGSESELGTMIEAQDIGSNRGRFPGEPIRLVTHNLHLPLL